MQLLKVWEWNGQAKVVLKTEDEAAMYVYFQSYRHHLQQEGCGRSGYAVVCWFWCPGVLVCTLGLTDKRRLQLQTHAKSVGLCANVIQVPDHKSQYTD